ncbi:MAG: family 10 glycosylhydrolase [Phycisphaerales bacterium]|nr:family 10 glycosylhydrolase [Phycisphaerales bacterium]
MANENYVTTVTPNPGAGKFRLRHDPDRPVLGFYGGIGLWKLSDGRWTGYGVKSKEQVDYLIQRCKENGMNRIYASMQEEQYSSKYTPSPVEGSTDYIAYCIQRAHEEGIEFYADMPIFAYVHGKNDEFAKAHPEVFTRDQSGVLDTHMFSAAWPLVRQYKRALLMEFVQNYPIDGLQLDFIRYPYYWKNLREGYCRHGYDQPSLEKFRREFGYNASYVPTPNDPRWLKVRSDTVTQFIRELCGDLEQAGVKLPIGVYDSGTYGRKDSYHDVLQDWQQWETEGLVDQHSPMFLMTAGMGNLAYTVQSLMEVKRPSTELLGPIFLAEGFNTDQGDVPTADMVRDAARRMIKLGCNSLWFCRASEIEQYDLWPVVKEISQWSIKEIRGEDFDPFYENLLATGAIQPGVEVQLAANKGVELTQVVKFRPIQHLSVDSLAIKVKVDFSGAKVEGPAGLRLKLKYKNGMEETVSYRTGVAVQGMSELVWTVPVTTDFNTILLTEAQLTVEFPRGTGKAVVQGAEMIRDPLLRRP